MASSANRKIVATESNPPAASAFKSRELSMLIGVWLALAVALLWLGATTANSLGFNYDEAIFAGMA